MSIVDWLTVFAVVLCLLISAFFSASETALAASSRAAMLRLEKQGNRDAGIVNRLMATRERLLGAILFANNFTNIAASTLAPRGALEAIARSRPRTVDEIMKTGDLLCWQAELVQGAVEKCLHSTRLS